MHLLVVISMCVLTVL